MPDEPDWIGMKAAFELMRAVNYDPERMLADAVLLADTALYTIADPKERRRKRKAVLGARWIGESLG